MTIEIIFLALVMAAVSTHPQWTLVALAYSYLLSAFIGITVSKFRKPAPTTPPVEAELEQATGLDTGPQPHA